MKNRYNNQVRSVNGRMSLELFMVKCLKTSQKTNINLLRVKGAFL